MITVTCLLVVLGQAKTQAVTFEYDSAQASKFLAGYGHISGLDVKKLKELTCQDLDYTLAFFDEE